ncbi:DUF1501 domain-containing protein [Symmachiella dynata]|uniref:DUF1501 domain-containing protein n=1 Tax=Symmachiella dynata TaxID=2527995 RepID=UPI0030EED14D
MTNLLGLKSIPDSLEAWKRRDLLQAGALGALGLSARGASWANATEAVPPAAGRAKRCLLLYIYGAWSQLDTFDPKPDAPEEIRGEFGSVQSCLSGVRVNEYLPQTAQVLDRCTLVRSMSHPWNIHSASYTLTGNPDTARIEGRQRHPEQWPYLGSLVDYVGERGELGESAPGVPRNVMLPWRQSLYANPNKRSGTFGGFLGTAYDPLWTEFDGEMPLGDPFRAITPEGRFAFGAGSGAPLSTDELQRRRSLLSRLEGPADTISRAKAAQGYARQRAAAFELLATPQVTNALRIERESAALRDEYGMTLFGQSCLAARRLLEADVKFVTVVWDEYGQTDESWDTHYDHHSRLKEFLLPAFDRAYAALIRDLDQRGLLDDTLVLCLSEHGRTPKFFATAAGAPGRDHWSRAYSQLFAGAGVPRGQVVGATDAVAGDVIDHAIDPKDVLCTACHLLGVDPRQEILASPGRPVPLVAGGRTIPQLLG